MVGEPRRQDSVTSAGLAAPDRSGYRESGSGILEFSPAKAGQDVTPANLDFSHRKHAPFVGWLLLLSIL